MATEAIFFPPDTTPPPPVVVVDTDGTYVYSGDHVERAVAQLIEIFRKPRNGEWLAVTVGQVQELEDALWSLLTAFDLDADSTAGAQLDLIGKIVGERRGALTDVQYRPALRARILTNSSNGRIEDLIGIIKALVPSATLGDIHIVEHYPAALTIELYDDFTGALPETIARMLRQAKPAGVRLNFVPVNTGETLIWRSPAGSDAVNGWGAKWARRL